MKLGLLTISAFIFFLVGVMMNDTYAQTSTPANTPTPSPTKTVPTGAPNTGYGAIGR